MRKHASAKTESQVSNGGRRLANCVVAHECHSSALFMYATSGPVSSTVAVTCQTLRGVEGYRRDPTDRSQYRRGPALNRGNSADRGPGAVLPAPAGRYLIESGLLLSTCAPAIW